MDKTALCLLCMEFHTIKIVKMTDSALCDGKWVELEIECRYCEYVDSYLETEEQIKANWKSMWDAREMLG